MPALISCWQPPRCVRCRAVHTLLAHPDTHLPALSGGHSETLRTYAAYTLEDAISLLLAEQGSRWGAIPDYTAVRRQHTKLVERIWLSEQVNDAINQAMDDASCPHHILITGGPGTGKTAFVVAQVEKDETAACHFIRRGGGLDDPVLMLTSLTAQLQRIHALPDEKDGKSNPAAAFRQMLEHAAQTLQDGERQVIWIDGLDEAFGPLGAYHAQPLDRLLPLDNLPDKVALVMTSRSGEHLNWLNDPQRFRRIDLDQPENRQACLADIRKYLANRSLELDLKLEPGLLERLTQASEGCFMAAVRYLNPAGDPAALHQRIAGWRRAPQNIPPGLEGWLEHQWNILLSSARSRGIQQHAVYAVMGMAAYEEGLRVGTGTNISMARALRIAARFLKEEEMLHLDEIIERVNALAGEFYERQEDPSGQMRFQFFHSRFREFVREIVEKEAARLDGRAGGGVNRPFTWPNLAPWAKRLGVLAAIVLGAVFVLILGWAVYQAVITPAATLEPEAPPAAVFTPTGTPRPDTPTPTVSLTLPLPTAAPVQPSAGDMQAVIAGQDCALLASPAQDAAVLKPLETGESVEIFRRSDDAAWLAVIAANLPGWVQTECVSTEIDIASLLTISIVSTPTPTATFAPPATSTTTPRKPPKNSSPPSSPTTYPGP